MRYFDQQYKIEMIVGLTSAFFPPSQLLQEETTYVVSNYIN